VLPRLERRVVEVDGLGVLHSQLNLLARLGKRVVDEVDL
jgi:hypothetical protein